MIPMIDSEILITDLIGDQSPTLNQDPNNHSVYFMVPIVNDRGAVKDFAMQRVICNRAKAYFSLEELLEDKQLLPDNAKAYSIDMLKRHIAADAKRGFGAKVRDYPLVAYVGRSGFDKPVAQVRRDTGDLIYYVSPIFSSLVKRI
jgi:hypothetical protein